MSNLKHYIARVSYALYVGRSEICDFNVGVKAAAEKDIFLHVPDPETKSGTDLKTNHDDLLNITFYHRLLLFFSLCMI
jgi:hypothetical protein